MTKTIIIYLIAINIVSISLMYIDKKKAKKHKWRISENTLISLSVIGGSIGGLCGMYAFHHKTKHAKFSLGIPVILIIQILLAFWIIQQY